MANTHSCHSCNPGTVHTTQTSLSVVATLLGYEDQKLKMVLTFLANSYASETSSDCSGRSMAELDLGGTIML